jgi:hypothetical protein
MLKWNKTDEICALLGYYAALSGSSVPTFRDNLSFPSSRVKKSKKKKFRQKKKIIFWNSKLRYRWGLNSKYCSGRRFEIYNALHFILYWDLKSTVQGEVCQWNESDDTPDACVGFSKFPVSGMSRSCSHCFVIIPGAKFSFTSRVTESFAVSYGKSWQVFWHYLWQMVNTLK